MAVIGANIVLGFLLGIVVSVLSLSQATYTIIANFISLVVTIYASIYFFRYVFEKFHIYVPPKRMDEYKKAALK